MKMKSTLKQHWIKILLGLLVLVVWVSTPRWMNLLIPSSYTNSIYDVHGKFGDSFNVTTSLFSVLAFLTIAWTAWMQKTELSLQRQEMRDNRQALIDQKDQLQRTADLQEKANRIDLLRLRFDSKLANLNFLKDSGFNVGLRTTEVQNALGNLDTEIESLYREIKDAST
jgi:hypothetical protein